MENFYRVQQGHPDLRDAGSHQFWNPLCMLIRLTFSHEIRHGKLSEMHVLGSTEPQQAKKGRNPSAPKFWGPYVRHGMIGRPNSARNRRERRVLGSITLPQPYGVGPWSLIFLPLNICWHHLNQKLANFST